MPKTSKLQQIIDAYERERAVIDAILAKLKGEVDKPQPKPRKAKPAQGDGQ